MKTPFELSITGLRISSLFFPNLFYWKILKIINYEDAILIINYSEENSQV